MIEKDDDPSKFTNPEEVMKLPDELPEVKAEGRTSQSFIIYYFPYESEVLSSYCNGFNFWLAVL